MVEYVCYFCKYTTNRVSNLKKHILNKKKCSYLLRTSEIKINNIEDYNFYVELHKKEPDNDIWGIDYSSIPKPNYDSSSDEDKEYNHEYINFMNKISNPIFNCQYCNSNYSNKYNLKRHEKCKFNSKC